jgi:hypothetical protein
MDDPTPTGGPSDPLAPGQPPLQPAGSAGPEMPSTAQVSPPLASPPPASPPPGPFGPPIGAPPEGPKGSGVPAGPVPVAWEQPQARRGTNPVVVAGLVIVLLVIGGIVGLIFIGANASPFDRAVAKATARLVTDPTFTSRYGNLKGDDAFKVGGQLVTDGIRRTDAPTQLVFAQSLDKLLNVADKPTCAGILKGTTKPSDAADLIRKLDEASLNAYMDSTISAALASLHGDPVRAAPADADAEHAQQAWVEAIGREKFSTDVDTLQSTSPQTDDNVCAAGRELWDAAVNLPEPDRGTVVLLLFSTQ